MSQAEEDALLMDTHKHKNEFGTYFVNYIDQDMMKAY